MNHCYWLFVSIASAIAFASLSFAQHSEEEVPNANFRMVDEPIFKFDPLGRVFREQRRRVTYGYPQLLGFLRSKQEMKSVGLSEKEQKSLTKKFVAIEERFKKLTLVEFASACREIEDLLRRRLGEKALEVALRQSDTSAFYRLGPREYFRIHGLTSLEMAKAVSNCQSIEKHLATKLQELEAKVFSDFLNRVVISGEAVNLKNVSPVRSPVLSTTVLYEKDKIANNESKSKPGTYHFDYFYVSPSGSLRKYGETTENPLSRAMVLVSGQEWELKNDPSIKVFFEMQFETMLQLQRTLSEKQKEVKAKSISNADKKREIEMLRDRNFAELIRLAEEIHQELNDDEQRTYCWGVLLSNLQRRGLGAIAAETECTKHLGISIADRKAVSKAAEATAKEIQKEMLQLHEELIPKILDQVTHEPSQLKWDKRFGTPPLELLLHDIRNIKKGD